MKKVKVISIALGVISLTFGLLKFVSPFKDWYATQIETSGLPPATYALGIAGEIMVGIAFLVPFITVTTMKQKRFVLLFANISLGLIMIAATIVHLIPDVPASVLPLKIKPPFIPLAFLGVAIYNLTKLSVKHLQVDLAEHSNRK